MNEGAEEVSSFCLKITEFDIDYDRQTIHSNSRRREIARDRL